jgi:hypothetical protein
MIRETFAREQFKRFRVLDGCPAMKSEAETELLQHFVNAFDDELVAQDFVDSYLLGDTPRGCDLCSERPHSPGWLSLSDDGQGISTRCVCRGGNPQLREQALYRLQRWQEYPLGTPEVPQPRNLIGRMFREVLTRRTM